MIILLFDMASSFSTDVLNESQQINTHNNSVEAFEQLEQKERHEKYVLQQVKTKDDAQKHVLHL